MTENDTLKIKEYLRELNENLDSLIRLVPIFNGDDSDDVPKYFCIGIDMLRTLKHDISDSTNLKSIIDIDSITQDWQYDQDKLTSSTSKVITKMKTDIETYGEKGDINE